jgi:hypothetical protein
MLLMIQLYLMKFVCDFAEGQWISTGTPVSSTNKN